MRYSLQLLQGTLLKRYKRFFADVELNGKKVIAHVPNSGSMKGCNEPGSLCRVTFHNKPDRKLQYTLEQVQTPTGWVGVNTSIPNKLVQELYEAKTHWKKFDFFEREVKISDKSRIDAVLWKGEAIAREDLRKTNFKKSKQKFHFVEVKNVSLGENKKALFPDSVTERGAKHLEELMTLVDVGHTCEMVYVIQRMDCSSFSPADEIDAHYGKLLREAKKRGVVITPLTCLLSENEVQLSEPLKIKL